jgi:hypothetical protein
MLNVYENKDEVFYFRRPIYSLFLHKIRRPIYSLCICVRKRCSFCMEKFEADR